MIKVIYFSGNLWLISVENK